MDVQLAGRVLGHFSPYVPVPPKRCIKGKITHKKWAEKFPLSTANPGLKLVHPLGMRARKIVPCRAYRAWKNPNAVGLGAIQHWEAGTPKY